MGNPRRNPRKGRGNGLCLRCHGCGVIDLRSASRPSTPVRSRPRISGRDRRMSPESQSLLFPQKGLALPFVPVGRCGGAVSPENPTGRSAQDRIRRHRPGLQESGRNARVPAAGSSRPLGLPCHPQFASCSRCQRAKGCANVFVRANHLPAWRRFCL